MVAGTVTSGAAYAIDHPELGLVKKGRIADVIVVEGNPLKNLELLRNVEVVVHNGVLVRSKYK